MTKMPRLNISSSDIERVKRQHILENLSYSVVEAAEVLGVSARKVYHLVEQGDLVDANDNPGRRGTRITALSVTEYNQKRIKKAEMAREC